MRAEPSISESDFVLCLSEALDLADSAVTGHHRRVAIIAAALAAEAGLSPEEQETIAIAAALHDAGALTLRERLDCLEFEVRNPHLHAETGFLLLHDYPPLAGVACLIRNHHVPWHEGAGCEFSGREVAAGSHLLHLADRIDILINPHENPLDQVDKVRGQIVANKGRLFIPEHVEIFEELSRRESFWLEIATAASPACSPALPERQRVLTAEEIEKMAAIFTRVIDFRSRFTVWHSAGVAATAETLAAICGMGGEELILMRIAGRLHDLGKLGVPTEILDKPTGLSTKDFNLIRAHTFHTYRILRRLKGLREVAKWAAYHHEHLDGTGYPFHVRDDELSLGSRIMATADIFTAMTEDRPYRRGMRKQEVGALLQDGAKRKWLDGDVVGEAVREYERLDDARSSAQEHVADGYLEVVAVRSGSKLLREY